MEKPGESEIDFWRLVSELNVPSMPDDQDNFTFWINRNHSYSLNRSRDVEVFTHVVRSLDIYLTPIIIIVGIVGNMLSFLVFSFTHLERLSSSVYLSTLALADVGFLVGLFVVWLDRIDVEGFTKEGWCQVVIYVTQFCGFLAVWNVVSFTAERYIIVYHPLRKDTFCTKVKARFVVLGLVIFSQGLYLYVFWVYDAIRIGPHLRLCAPNPLLYDVTTIMLSLDTLCACVVPSLLIVILNVRIILKIHHYQTRQATPLSPSTHLVLTVVPEIHNPRRRSGLHTSFSTTGSMHIKFSRHSPGGGADHSPGGADPNDTEGGKQPPRDKRMLRSRSQFRTARMLLVLSSVFVLLNLPNHVFRVHGFLTHLLDDDAKAPKVQAPWQKLFSIVYFLNFAVNFFIYSVCGRQFRTGLRRLCRRWRYKLRKCGQLLHLGRHLQARRRERIEAEHRPGLMFVMATPELARRPHISSPCLELKAPSGEYTRHHLYMGVMRAQSEQ